MNKKVTMVRGVETKTVILRQMPHDEQMFVGKRFQYGAGPKWVVVEVKAQ